MEYIITEEIVKKAWGEDWFPKAKEMFLGLDKQPDERMDTMSIEREGRAESVRAFPLPHEAPRNANERRANGIVSAHRAGYVEGYIAGASRPVTDEEVEAACIGFYNDVDGLTDWESLASKDPPLAEKYRSAIRRALEAARALADKETQ